MAFSLQLTRSGTAGVLFVATAVLAGATSSAQTTNRGPFSTETYLINAASFGNEFGTASPVRVIEHAARQWTWAGGARVALENAGSTAATGCALFSPNHVYGVQGCDPSDPPPGCTTLADFSPGGSVCVFGGFAVRVWLGGEDFSLAPTTALQMDFQIVMQHELGHFYLYDHVEVDSTCIMHADTLLSEGNRQRYFCGTEIDLAGDYVGHPWAYPYYMRSSSWPLPSGSGWSAPLPAGTQFGFGMADAFRTENSTAAPMFFGNISSLPHDPKVCPDYRSACTPTNIVSNSLTQTKPSVAYDWTRSRWWVAYQDGYNGYVGYATSTDLLNWTAHGAVRNSSGMPIPTRTPVGIAYDAFSDHVVVVFTTWLPYNQYPPCPSAFGCTNDQRFVTIGAGVPGSTWQGAFALTGMQGSGPPAVACENSSAYYECQVLTVGVDPNRHIWSYRFCLDSAGNHCGTSGAVDTGGWTDYPIGLTFNGQNANGYWVAAVTGASLSNVIYINQKRNVIDAWGGWVPVAGSTTSRLGPVIRIRAADQSYELLYAPQ